MAKGKKGKEKGSFDMIDDIKKANDQNAIISRASSELLDVRHDTKTEKLLNKLAINDISYTNRGDITSIVGVDKETGLPFQDAITMIMKASSERMNTQSYRRFIRSQVLENRWMLENMPQLKTGLILRKTSIFTPDDVNKSSYIYKSKDLDRSTENTMEIGEVIQILKDEADFEKLGSDIYDANSKDGFCFVYIIEYAELANELQAFAKDKKSFEKFKGIYEILHEKPLEGDFNISESGIDGEVTGLNYENICEMIDLADVTQHTTSDTNVNYFEAMFPKNPWTDDFKAMYKNKIKTNGELMISEAQSPAERKATNFFTNIFGFSGEMAPVVKNTRLNVNGLFIKILDSSKTIPVMIGKEVLGVYHVEEADSIGLNKLTSVRSILDRDRSMYNVNTQVGKASIVDYLRKLIERNIDTKFLKNNKHILKELRDVINDSILGENGMKIRFIPKQYLEVMTDTSPTDEYPLGRSILQDAKAPIYSHILENKNIQLTEMFHKRNKIIAKINTKGITTDMEEYVERALDALEQMYSGANLHNMFDVQTMYTQMANIGRIIIPTDANGNDIITIDQIEGQKTTDNLEILRMYERTVSTILNTTVSSDEDQYMQFASSYANRNLLAAKITSENQRHYSWQYSRLATNLFRRVNPKLNTIDPTIEITFPAPKTLPNTQTNDIITTVMSRAEELANKFFAEEEQAQKRHYIRGYMTKHLAGVEDIEKDYEEIMSTYNKNAVPMPVEQEGV